jgi:hypothetical protein
LRTPATQPHAAAHRAGLGKCSHAYQVRRAPCFIFRLLLHVQLPSALIFEKPRKKQHKVF